ILLNLVTLNSSMVLLDVATGAGHTAVKFAPYVKHVTAIDITPEMIDRAQELAASKNIKNITPVLMDAESLRFSDNSFDVVSCRFAPHHFGSVKKFLSEIYRVLKPKGVFVLEDTISPLDKEQDIFINKINKIRDPTHIRSYNQSEWTEMIESSGLQIQSIQNFRRAYNIEAWLTRAGANDNAKETVKQMCRNTSQKISQYFEILQNTLLTFTEDHIIILSKKNYP
ncbi:MAG: class I SAM-dependent methyltransferase, partial [Patescibacteria group bacterium]|nr:class I SAM-dependent methyltransferase [Patescibacteria group bacterium]